MSTQIAPVNAAAAVLRARGFALCKPDPREKKPTYKGWSARSLEPNDFAEGDQISILGGPLSDGGKPGHAAVLLDLDAREAVELADSYLPATDMMEGRQSKPRSHRNCLVPLASIPEWAFSTAEQGSAAAKEQKGHPGPFTKSFRHRDTEAEVLRFVGTGGQVVCPPSMWQSEDGTRSERREWEGGAPGEPGVVTFLELWRGVCELASACGCEIPDVMPRSEADDSTTRADWSESALISNRVLPYLAKCDASVSGQRGHDKLFNAARSLVYGFDLGMEVALSLLKDEFNPRCKPEWSDKELRHKVENADRIPFDKPRGYLRDTPLPNGKSDPKPTFGSKDKPDGKTFPPLNSLSSAKWPAEMAKEAFHGLAGRFVEAVKPASEADPVALLVQLLLAFGNAAGRKRFALVEGDRHYMNENGVLVGRSSKGRKGTSWGRVRSTLAHVVPEWTAERVMSGLSSGEGVIWNVRDPISKQERVPQRKGEPAKYETVVGDEGVEDKRLFVTEPEFANVLKQTERQGNTLSPILRQSWDGGALKSMTKNSPAQASDSHISIVGHITEEELHRYLTATETANGFGNRFLWFLVRRSKFLPEGGTPDAQALEKVEADLRASLVFAGTAGEIKRDNHARALWCEVYSALSGDRRGLAGSLTGRAEAHVLRLSLIYAALDRSAVVKSEHLMAALAVWDYADESVRCLFGDALGSPLADQILTLLRASESGLTRNEIREAVGRSMAAERLEHALGLLREMHLARSEQKGTAGRTAELWHAVKLNGGES